MGQGKLRKADLSNWRGALSPQERTIFEVADASYRNIVRALGATGICYRMAFFLTEFLHSENGIDVQPVVGFVNDGETPIMASHAWIEFNSKKTDLSLTMTENPQAQPPGPLLILDRAFGSHRARYSYHREQSAESTTLLEELGRDPRYRAVIIGKDQEHRRMTEISRSRGERHRFLDAAPDRQDFEAWADRVRPSLSNR